MKQNIKENILYSIIWLLIILLVGYYMYNNSNNSNNQVDSNNWQEYQKESSKIENLNPRFTQWSLSINELNRIKDNSFIEWPEDARITWLEYSDLECPYCKRQNDQWVISQVMDDNNWKVNHSFKNFPIISLHPSAKKWAKVLQCVWQLEGAEKYHEYMDNVFSNLSNFTEDNYKQIAYNMWISEEDIDSCYNSQEASNEVEKSLNEWKNIFWIRWTPWNVLIDNETWRYVVIQGAYPVSSFNDVISKMIK